MKKVMIFDKLKSQDKPRYTEALNRHLKTGSNAEVIVDYYKQIVIEFGNDYIDIDDLLNKLEVMADDIKEIYLIPHDKKNEKFVLNNVDHLHIYIKTTKHKNTLYSIVNKVKKTDKKTFESQLQNINKINVKILTLKQKIQEERNNMPQVILHTRSLFSVDPADLQNIQNATDAKLIKPFGIEIPVGSSLSGTGNELQNIKQNQRTKKLPLYYEFYIQNVNNSLTNQQRQNLINDLQNKFGNNIQIITNNNNEIEFKIKNFTIKNNELIINKKETLFLELLKELEKHNILTLNMENKTEAIFRSISDDLIEKKNSNNQKLQQEYNNYINSVIQTFTNKPVIKTSSEIEDRFLTIYQKDLEKYKEKLHKLKNQREIQIYKDVIQQLENILNQYNIKIQQQTQAEQEKEINQPQQKEQESKEENKESKEINLEEIDDIELKKQLEEIEKEIENIKNNKYLNNEIKKEALKDLENKRIEIYNEYMNKVKERLEKELKEIKEAKELLEKDLKLREEEITELNDKLKEVEEAKKKFEEESKKIEEVFDMQFDNIDDFKQELLKRSKVFNGLVQKVNNKIDEYNTIIDNLRKENTELKNKLKDKEELLKEKENQIVNLVEERNNLNAKVKEQENQIEILNEKTKEYEIKFNNIQAIDNKINEIIKNKNIDINKKIELLKKLKEENKEKIIENTITNTIILLKNLDNKNKEIVNLKDTIKNKENEYKEKINKVKKEEKEKFDKEIKNKENEYNKKLNEKEQKIEKIEKQLQEFREILDALFKEVETFIKKIEKVETKEERKEIAKQQKEVINNIKNNFFKSFKLKN